MLPGYLDEVLSKRVLDMAACSSEALEIMIKMEKQMDVFV